MRIVGDEAKLNFVERWIVGGPRRQAIGAVACAAAMERLDGRQHLLDKERPLTKGICCWTLSAQQLVSYKTM